MSELREEILGGGINKKRIIGVVLVAVILISVFAFSTFFISFLFGSLRTPPNKKKSDTDYVVVEKIAPPLPLNFLAQLAEFLTPEQLLDLAQDIDPQDLADLIDNMNDGVIDDLDLSQFSQALLPLLFGVAGLIERFRIYDYDSINEMTDALWRYEVFDEYTGDQWTSNANSLPFNFISQGEYFSQYGSQDKLQIKMPLSTNIGLNLMGLPILFPTPFILDNSIDAPNLVPDSETLAKDDFNSTSVNLDFTSADSVNMTFELFGLDLLSEQEIYNSAVLVSATRTSEYTNILNQFTQLPPDFNSYYSSQLNFQTHFDALDLIININTDNAFVIANKTRNYLQSHFTYPTSPDEYQSAPEGRDSVDWFLEQGIGVFSDFATAFCVFTRAFNVASRFVDGFRAYDLFSRIEEIFDPAEGKNALVIRYKNMYNWAEIYIPTDIDGDGMWAQFDVSSGGGGILPPDTFAMTVNSNFTAGPRGQVANLTAILISSQSQSVENKSITFTDYTYGVTLGNATTDINGTASILININSSQVVGPHVIIANYGLTFNWTTYTIYGDIDVNLTNVNPAMIDRSISNSTSIQGYVNDPIANQRVKNATVVFLLFDKGTNNNISLPFDTFYANADDSGNFNEIVNVNPWVPRGYYEIRVDFNGSWNLLPLALGIMNDSSNRMGFNVSDPFGLIFTIQLAVEGINTVPVYNNSYRPAIYTRGQIAFFEATVLQSGFPAPDGTYVTIWDDNSSRLLGNQTIFGGNGYVQFLIPTNNFYRAGIQKIRVQYMNFLAINTTFIIINEPVTIANLTSSVSEILRDNGNFTISGYVKENGTGLQGLRVSLQLFNISGGNSSQYINGSKNFITLSNGYFQFDINNIYIACPQGRYNLRVDFNGSIFLNEIPGIDLIPYYMISTSSSPLPLNITAETYITQDGYHTKSGLDPTQWIFNDILYVYGNLTWDNGTIFANMFINVTIKLLDGTVIAFNDTVQTDNFGQFNVSLTIGYWPTERVDTEIWVYFDPNVNNIKYVGASQLQFT